MRLLLGDCLDQIATIPDASVDAIITDPPYPEINRPYGRMTEVEWDSMMRRLIPECRRVLKPTGSAVFILQPNSRKVGSMRPWLWEFMAWTCREWNMVQDIWWWNSTSLPLSGTTKEQGLTRASIKSCVWLGDPCCFRDQDQVLWSESQSNAALRARARFERTSRSSIGSLNNGTARSKVVERGGVTPFNLLPIPGGGSKNIVGGHSAATPLELADWWTRYISPPDGVILDPFMGSGTMGLAALSRARSFVGIERDRGYFAIAERRIAKARAGLPLLAGVAS